MSRSLAGIAEGTVGGFTLGISTSRAPIICPVCCRDITSVTRR
ncbi:MAG: hypothetical protein V8R18_07220 [Clostridium sp.]